MNWHTLLSSNRLDQKRTTSEISRSTFEQDFDRIIFSHPFRRLQDKTQVHPLPEHDFVHTRLTHSLEVSSVGRSLGKKVGEIIIQRHPQLNGNFSLFDFGAIVASASLAHDLGNPPFGHAGEDAISDFFVSDPFGKSIQQKVTKAEWEDLIQFEGNAQGFRIINSYQYGLKLSIAALGAFTKYPCASLLSNRATDRKSQKKYGFFQTEHKLFEELATQLEIPKVNGDAWLRHPLAFLVEAADDVCYNIIDLEDGCRLGLVSLEDTIALLADILKKDFDKSKLEKFTSKNEKVAVLRAMAINKLIDECAKAFLEHEQSVLNGKFDKPLVEFCESKNSLNSIQEISISKIYRAKHVVEIEAAGHEVLPGLLHEFAKAGDHLFQNGTSKKYDNLVRLLPDETQLAIRQSKSYYQMVRNIVDFVSGMTDRYALSVYKKIKGIALA